MLKLSRFSRLWAVSLLLIISLVYSPAFGRQVSVTELVGRAVLPSDTFAVGLTTGQLLKSPINHRRVPFKSATPVQGFSTVLPGPVSGTYLVLSDNGFGGKANSPDYVLRIYAVAVDFSTTKVFPVDIKTGERLNSFNRRSFLELNDKNSQVSFPIVAEQTNYPGTNIPVNPAIKTGRLLTGGDFDPESCRRVSDGSFWIGDEFGPFLLHVDSNGQLLSAPIELPNFLGIGKLNFVKSPDAPGLLNMSNAANLGGSKGFEGLAVNQSGTKLYAMLEGSIIGDSIPNRLLIHEFDLGTQKYTGKIFSYRLQNPSYAIGELTAINDNEFIVIERDHKQGDPNNPAFRDPAKFKRLYKININQIDSQGFVAKELLVDLLNISDPNNLGGKATTNGRFTFPFVTIESVLPIDARTLLIVNDNNYPSTVGRNLGQPDNTEFITIRLDKPLDIN
ncbi:MAG: esterase-like activity of phytase family protein [Nostocaceae cyanobacterium]|nr:esterase-like activity of phytase family protein [Nostocaceae cyanobacterium]